MKAGPKAWLEVIKDLLERASAWLAGFRFDSGWHRGPVLAVGVLVALSGAYLGWIAQSGFGRGLDTLAGLTAGVVGYGAALLFGWLALKAARSLPAIVIAALIIGLGVQVFLVWGETVWVNWLFGTVLAFAAASLGAGVYALKRGEWGGTKLRKRVFLVVLMVFGAGIYAGLAVLLLLPGEQAAALPLISTQGVSVIDAFDPSLPGPYQVATLTYGSGTDLRRPEYGEEVDLVTEPVNAASYISYKRLARKARAWYWGFDTDTLPRNGRVWYPVGDGPFPLVLVVHGNHAMTEYSDPGYAYLGELLASRGFIVVSVDENFLNGGLYGRATNENDGRAWLLLKHLELWEVWNAEKGSPFYTKVDMNNIALIGHSRGGEAVAHAALFNRLSHNPDNANIRWDFNYSIQAVVAIAPIDLQYQPAGHSTTLRDVSFLVLQGSHDADVYFFSGAAQYQRVQFTDPESSFFKASVYIYRANHGQFNSLWGARDKSGIKGQLLNRQALLAEEEQQRITSVYISAFLEATLKQNTAYLPLFQDFRTAGDWLPETTYISQFQDAGTQLVADYEEDVDVNSASLPGSRLSASGLSVWKEEVLRYRNNTARDDHAVRLGWRSLQARYILRLPTNLAVDWDLDGEDLLVLSLADGRKPDEAEELLDLSIILRDATGEQASIRLSDVMLLPPPLTAEISRLKVWNKENFRSPTEVVMQSFRIPLALFVARNHEFDPGTLREVWLAFDQAEQGEVLLDEIGFDLSN